MALKVSAIISTDILTRMSRAQQVFLNDILLFNKKEKITLQDLKQSLLEIGIQFEEQEVQDLFNHFKFNDNQTDTLSRLEIYANAHLFRLDNKLRSGLLRRVAIGCGTGLNDNDWKLFEKFAERLVTICNIAHEKNTSLYVDAE